MRRSPAAVRVARCLVRQDAAGTELIDFLERRFTYHSRAEWLALLAEGRVLLDGLPGSGLERLGVGSVIEYRCGDVPEPEVPRDIRIVHEDAEILVVDKPAGLPVHPAGRYYAHTLWSFLRERLPAGVHFVSRLDRETSGLLLVAKDAACARRYQALLACGGALKIYLAAVHGDFPDECVADGWLHADPESLIRKKRRFRREQSFGPGEQVAWTRFSCLARHGGLSLLRAELATGRTHQIRATLCSLGFPVVGDKIYGPDETLFLRFRDGSLSPDDLSLLRLPRQALHSWRLHIDEAPGVVRRWVCPPPEDMLKLFPGTVLS